MTQFIRLLGVTVLVISARATADENIWLTVERGLTLTPTPAARHYIPQFGRGFVIVRRAGTEFQVYRQSGALLASVPISVPEATKVNVRDVAVAPDGRLAVSAGAFSAKGHFASVILWLDTSGAISRVVSTSPFAAARLVFTPDGSLWALGRVHDSNFETTSDHDILRKYDTDGRLCQTALPLREFPSSGVHPMTGAFLLVSESRLGLYSTTANEWIELSFSGQVLARYRTPKLPQQMQAIGAAFTDAEGLCLSLRESPKAGHVTRTMSSTMCRFDRTSQSFVTVRLLQSEVTSDSDVGVIVGSDGPQLVFYKKPTTFTFVRLKRN